MRPVSAVNSTSKESSGAAKQHLGEKRWQVRACAATDLDRLGFLEPVPGVAEQVIDVLYRDMGDMFAHNGAKSSLSH